MPAEPSATDVRNAIYQLRTLAERTHYTRDQVPLADPYHPPRLCDLDDSAHAIAGLVTFLAHDADMTRITATSANGERTDLTRFMISELAQATATAAHALAALGEVIAFAGARASDETPRFTAVGNRAKQATPVELAWIRAVHDHLAATARRLHQAADRLSDPLEPGHRSRRDGPNAAATAGAGPFSLTPTPPRGVACLFPHPDFEAYDNVGRDAEQITAAKHNRATRLDLITWARADAAPFLADHPLPDSGPPELDLAAYRSALAAAQSPAEVSAVTQHLLDTAAPVLQAVSDCLMEAAQWRNRHRDATAGSPPKLLMAAAGRALDVLAIADDADIAALRAAYDPAPDLQPPAPGRPPALPPASPGAPSAGQARGR